MLELKIMNCFKERLDIIGSMNCSVDIDLISSLASSLTHDLNGGIQEDCKSRQLDGHAGGTKGAILLYKKGEVFYNA